MSSDLLGNTQRFNLPGSFGRETWCERLAFPLSDFATHSKYGERVRTAARLIAEPGRAPEGRRALPEHASSAAKEKETSAARS
jgi:4-alpha-glucanotransferase